MPNDQEVDIKIKTRKKQTKKRSVRSENSASAEFLVALEALTNITGLPWESKHSEKKKDPWQTLAKGIDGNPLAETQISVRSSQENNHNFEVDYTTSSTAPVPGLSCVEPLNSTLSQLKPLQGRTIYILLESQFVPQEIELYEERFKSYGASVEFVTRLWGHQSLRFHSHYDEKLIPEVRHMYVYNDISDIDLNDGKIAAVISPIDVHQRLAYDPGIVSSCNALAATQKSPAVDLLARALRHPRVVVGAFGHGVEILGALPELISGAKITGSPASIFPLVNAGAVWCPPVDPDHWQIHVVSEKSSERLENINLVTGTSVLNGGTEAFIDELTRVIIRVGKE